MNSKKIKSPTFRVYCIEIILNAIYYNPLLAFSLLEQANWTSGFFEYWFKNIDSFARVHDKKLCILVLCTIMEIPKEHLPASISSAGFHLFSGALQIFQTYPEALKCLCF